MARVRPVTPDVSLVRPLLGVRRSEILDYLQSIGQPYREADLLAIAHAYDSAHRWSAQRPVV